MGNVMAFPGDTVANEPPEDVLENMLVIGGSTSGLAEIMLLLELAKAEFIEQARGS